MYTTEMSVASDGMVGHWLISPHTDRYLVPGVSLEGEMFKEQQATFVQCLVLHGMDGLLEQLS